MVVLNRDLTPFAALLIAGRPARRPQARQRGAGQLGDARQKIGAHGAVEALRVGGREHQQAKGRGGPLTIQWAGGDAPVLMTGPATIVFQGEIDIPDNL